MMTVVFCDLRGFTAFAETAEPEEVMTRPARVSRSARRAHPQVRRHAASALPAMASWSCSTIRCHVPILRCAPFGMAVEMRDRVAALATQMAQVRSRARLRGRHRARLCHARPHRLRGPLRLFGQSARSSILPRDCAPRRKTDRSWSTARCSRRSRSLPRPSLSAGSCSRAFTVRSKPSM